MVYGKADLIWAYQYYLGHPPQDETLAADLAQGVDLTRLLYLSEERRQRGLAPKSQDDFCVWRRDRPKILVLSSCQGPALARVIAAMADVSVYGGQVVMTQQPDYAAQVMGLIETADQVLIADFSPYWGDFSEEKLRARFGAKICTYHRPFFEALHPDLTYLDKAAGPSPIGDYHSRLVIDSYLKGLSPADCLARFNAAEYRRIGFLGIAERAIEKLRSKDQWADVKIGDFILQHMKSHALFYSINHPTPLLQSAIAQRYLHRIGVEFHEIKPDLTPTVLSKEAIWPIDEAWAEVLQLNFSTGSGYWNQNHMISREDFIARSYLLYESVDPALLRAGLEALSL